MPRNPDKIDYSGGLPVGFERFTIVEDPRTGGNTKHHFGELKGHVVSVDAMGTQTVIATKIREQEADYLMALKGNQGALHKEVIDQFHFAKTQINRGKSEKWSLHEETEKPHGRVTTRKVAVTHDLTWMYPSIRKKWNGVKTLIAIESESYDLSKKKTTQQTRFYISSLESSAEVFQKLIRQHWSIENSCHWVVDTLFREDHSQVRKDNAAKNFSILGKVALNLLKADTSISKSLPMKQMRAMANPTYREQILSLAR